MKFNEVDIQLEGGSEKLVCSRTLPPNDPEPGPIVTL
jgi:hypothetical protein